MNLLIVTEDGTLATVTEAMAPRLFEAFKAWRKAPARSDAHQWNRVIEVAQEWLEDDGTDEVVDSVTEVGTGRGK